MANYNISGLVLYLATLLLTTWLVQFTIKWVRHRQFYKSLPCPPHSFLFGHLKEMGEVYKEFPSDVHPQVVLARLGEKYNLNPIFYVDLWPVARPIMVIQDLQVASLLTQQKSQPKDVIVEGFIKNMVGKRTIVTAEGADWKMLHAMFKPNFALAQVLTRVPDILQHVMVLRNRLEQIAVLGERIQLQEYAVRLTIDVIGENVLGKNLNSQNKYVPLVENFRKMVKLAVDHTDVIAKIKNRLPMWWYCRELDREIRAVVHERYVKGTTEKGTKRTMIDIALDAYRENRFGTFAEKPNKEVDMDKNFEWLIVNNVKALLLGGHDTTASSISHAIYLIWTHPNVLARMRAEHNSVFSSDPSQAAGLISSNPQLINNLPYTTACLKESLRLFPNGSTLRMSTVGSFSPENTISHPKTGQPLPLIGHTLWMNTYGMSRRADIWPNPLSFDPARFLPNADPPPQKDAFRSFEKGPRACLGQELAMTEMKLILVIVARDFDFVPDYAPDAPEGPADHGGPAYQLVAFGPKPGGGMPVRVKLRFSKT